MKQSHDKFIKVINDTKNADSTYDYLSRVVKPPYDYSDLLRWQWAQAVSALDKFVHDVVRSGMVNIYQGRRPSTPKYDCFSIPLNILSEMKSNPTQDVQVFEKQIILSNGYKSFQYPEKIAEALSYVWDENKKWAKIASYMNQDEHTVKTFLKNVVIRRNQIVHEGDYDGYSLVRQPITKSDASDVIAFIEKLGNAIYACVV